MKNLLFFLSLSFISFSLSSHAQTIYVDADAMGSNDGSTWNNAFVDLGDALAMAISGQEIWVAEGVYRPGGAVPNRESSFVIPDGVELYGGFTGNESTLDERNVQLNETVLSGDLNGDDVPGDFVNFRSDNAKHVVFVADNVGSSARIDGFTVSHGQTDGETAAGDDRRAGAILCYGAPVIANCYFTQNYGYYAGAVYPRGSASTNAVIEDCVFFDNLGGWGGAMYIATNDNVLIRNCIFEENISQNRAGAVYNDGNSTIFENCEFKRNSAASAGAVYHNKIDDSESATVIFRECLFTGNRGNFGGAMSLYGNGTSLLEQTTFDGNVADAGGGALSIGFTNNCMIEECQFSNNQADRGGAIWQQNDTTMVTIRNSSFETNLCLSSNGGAIYQRGSADLRIFDTRFEGNRASFGGAIYMIEDSVDISNLVVDRCFFNFNVADEQGGAINIGNADSYIQNTLISNSLLTSGIVGGAISINASAGDTTEVSMVNSTLYGNVAVIGAGVAAWTDGGDTSAAVFTSQNNIYANTGINYEVEDGDPTFVSNGGNLSTDMSLVGLANESNDLHDEDPMLVSPGSDDFHLLRGSPCIDNGTPDNAPAVDLEGNERERLPDIGAYEFQPGVSTRDIDRNVTVSAFPNPAKGQFMVTWESEVMGNFTIDVFDMDGRLIDSHKGNKLVRSHSLALDATSWAPGKYNLVIYQGTVRYTGDLMRI